jgi:hypothetical protein
MLGDALTSFTKPFQSLVISICLIMSDEARTKNTNSTCSRLSDWGKIILITPFLIRFFQNLNKMYYARALCPFGINCAKSLLGAYNQVLFWKYAASK